jgi:antitoxin component of MazEF toxin-antitoxin module
MDTVTLIKDTIHLPKDILDNLGIEDGQKIGIEVIDTETIQLKIIGKKPQRQAAIKNSIQSIKDRIRSRSKELTSAGVDYQDEDKKMFSETAEGIAPYIPEMMEE